MGNKKITTLLSILFIISFSLGVVGYMNRDNVGTNVTPEESNNTNTNTIGTMNYEGSELQLSDLDNKLNTFEFAKANNDFEHTYVKANISDGKITYTITKDALPEENLTEDLTYTVDKISSPVAVHARVDVSVEGALVKSYVMDSSKRLYVISFLASPSKHTNIDIVEYKVNGIESFIELDSSIFDEYTTDSIYVIFKTSEGDFYTDYIFEGDQVVLTKISSKAVIEESENIPVVNGNQDVNNTSNEEPVVEESNTQNTETQNETTEQNTDESVNNNQENNN